MAQNNRDMFDNYCESMQNDGTWTGHMELQAASLVTQCNICIHQHMTPRWYILNFGKHEARMIHLSYHGGEHYNSVRSKDDGCRGPAKPVLIKQRHRKEKPLLRTLKQAGGILYNNAP